MFYDFWIQEYQSTNVACEKLKFANEFLKFCQN